jgi:hypothetical protein
MRSTTARVTRMTKSYAPIKNGLTEALGIDTQRQNIPISCYCKVTKQWYSSDDFYIKKYYQQEDPKVLWRDDFRHVSKIIWDSRNENQKNGVGWISDYEIANPLPVTPSLEQWF